MSWPGWHCGCTSSRTAPQPSPQSTALGQRQLESTLTSYAQRYYTRNETIGLLGPITWGRFADQPTAIVVNAKECLTDQQKVWFEDWTIDRLGTGLAADSTIRWHLVPVQTVELQRLGRTVPPRRRTAGSERA